MIVRKSKCKAGRRRFLGVAAAFMVLAAGAAFMVFAAGAAGATEDPAGFIGMQVQGLNPPAAAALGLTEPMGALVRDLAPGGPADRAGIHQGDLIVRLGGQAIDTFETLLQVAGKAKPDQALPVTIIRAGKTIEATLTVGKWPPSLKIDRDATGHLPEAGLTMVALTPKMRNRFPVRWGATGVLVTLIDEGKASGIGIKRGEVIRQVNQEDVWLPEHVIARYKQAKAAQRGSILLLVEGAEGFRYIALVVR